MRPIVGIIGYGEDKCPKELYNFSKELGDALVSNGYRIACGGKGGIMEAVCMGAMNSESYFEGSVICIIPEKEKTKSNKFCDIVIPTGLNLGRNIVLINTADVIVILGGGAGTLSEIAFAWQNNKTLYALKGYGGWSEKLAEQKIDNTRNDFIIPFEDTDNLIKLINNTL